MKTQKSKKIIYGSYEDLKQRKWYNVYKTILLLISVLSIGLFTYLKFATIFPIEEGDQIAEKIVLFIFFWGVAMAFFTKLIKAIISPLPKKEDSNSEKEDS